MATQLFLRATAADTHLATDSTTLVGANPGWVSNALATTRGSGSTTTFPTSTVAGPTLGVESNAQSTTKLEWISPPVSADVTISGTITANIWGRENDMNANVAINVVIDIIRANATATRNSNTIVQIVKSTRVTELAVSTTVVSVNNFTTGMTSGGYTGQTLNRGDRLRIRIFGDDVGATNMGTGFTFTCSYDGTTAAVDGDTYVTFTENFSFESAPAGSVLYLTNTASDVTTASPALISAFTGSDENPLSEGGNWANLNTSLNALRRISNAVSAPDFSDCYSYWTPANFGPDLEAYVTLATVNGTNGIVFRVQGEGGAATWDGYRVTVTSTQVFIHSVTNAATSTVFSASGYTWASGDKLGVRCVGSLIQVWRQPSGSSDWNLAATGVNTTYGSAGKIGLYSTSSTARMDDFYAATDSNLFTSKAWTSRGAGVVSYLSDTDAGWTAPLYTHDWYTPELEAFTLTGMAQANIRALESNASANASLRCELARVDDDGTNPTVWASWCCAPTGTDNGELTTSEVARTINISGDDLAFTDGQRIRIRLYNEDISSAAMGNAFNVQRFYNGTSGGASGDSYVTLPQSVTEFAGGGPFTYEKTGYGREAA